MPAEYEFSLELIPPPRWEDVLHEFLSAMGRAEAMSGVTSGDTGGYVCWKEPYCLLSCNLLPKETLHQQILLEELGISINFLFHFRFRETWPWLPEIMRGVDHFLSNCVGDAVFLFNGDIVELVRHDGRLYLNNDPDVWTPYWLQFITQPYEMMKIPVLGTSESSTQ